MEHQSFLDRAVELAEKFKTNNAGGPFGAVIVKNNKIIAEGYNQVTAANDPTMHAEICAIRKACESLNTFQLNDCTIYSSCEPCPMCLAAIYWARINKIYYAADKDDAALGGFDDAFFYEEIQKDKTKRKIPMQKIPHPLEQKVFIDWNHWADKTPY